MKWYWPYVVHPNGSVTSAPDLKTDDFGDHTPGPSFVKEMAKATGYTWDSLTVEVIAGRSRMQSNPIWEDLFFEL